MLVQDPPVPWSPWCISMASANGYLEVVRFLREEGCDWEAWACRNAVEHDRPEMLRYLRVEARPPCPWDAEIRRVAILRWGEEAVKDMGEAEEGSNKYRGIPWRFMQREEEEKQRAGAAWDGD